MPIYIVSCVWPGGADSIEVKATSPEDARARAVHLLSEKSNCTVLAHYAISLDEIWNR